MNDNKPIRVAIVVAQFVTAGTKSYIMNYYRNIDRSVLQFDFIVNNTSDGNYQEIYDLGGNVFEVTPIMKNPVKNILETYRILKNNKYSICHALANALNIFPMFAAWLAGTPVRISENLSTAHPGERKTIVKNVLRPFSGCFANVFAANSKLSAQWLFGERECIILRNGIDLRKYRYDPELRENVRREMDLSDKFVIGHIGRYDYQKNHDYLIDIFSEVYKRNSKARLLLVGYGDLKTKVFEKIDVLGLREYVIDCGATEDIARLYNAMDCFVMPSFYEGLPVVGIEAQATGLPCVFSSEITKETGITEAAVFCSLNSTPAQWAEGILSFLNHSRKNQKRELADAGYDIERESVFLASLYIEELRKRQ